MGDAEDFVGKEDIFVRSQQFVLDRSDLKTGKENLERPYSWIKYIPKNSRSNRRVLTREINDYIDLSA